MVSAGNAAFYTVWKIDQEGRELEAGLRLLGKYEHDIIDAAHRGQTKFVIQNLERDLLPYVVKAARHLGYEAYENAIMSFGYANLILDWGNKVSELFNEPA